MLAVLIESRAARPRHTRSALVSTLAHGGIAALVVALSMSARGHVRSSADVHPVRVTFVQPEHQVNPSAPRTSSSTSSAVVAPHLPVIEVPILTPVGIPAVDLAVPSGTTEFRIGGRSDPGSSLTGSGILPASSEVNDVSAVDRAPRVMGRPVEPRYPSALRSAGVEGRVLAEFVVDTLGGAELATLRFPELPDPRFADAVRDALARTRFLPGEIAGRKVRTRVALPFDFRLVAR